MKSLYKNNPIHYNYDHLLFECFQFYAFFKEYGYSEIIEKFEYLLLFDSEKAMKLLSNFGNLIFGPKQNSLKSDDVFHLNQSLNYVLVSILN